MQQQTSDKPYVLITGGSLGIGLELAKLFATDRYNLIIVSKPEDELNACSNLLKKTYPGIDVITIQKDLSVQGAAKEVYNEVKKAGVEIDVLVNNAGFATYGYMDDISIERELSMINLNVVAVYHLTRLFMRDMIKRDHGKILNVASTAGLSPIPHVCTYAATKAFSHNFSVALNYELVHAGSSVRVATLCPPAVRNTGFAKAAGVEDAKIMNSPMAMEAPEVAKAAYKALFKEKTLILPGFLTRLVMNFIHLIPTNLKMKALMSIL